LESYQQVIRLGHLLPLVDPPPEILDRLREALRTMEPSPELPEPEVEVE